MIDSKSLRMNTPILVMAHKLTLMINMLKVKSLILFRAIDEVFKIYEKLDCWSIA